MLKHGILGLLNYGSMTGYEITRTFRDSLHYFWSAQTSQVYRELQTLKKNGWATDEVIAQSDRPDKKLFSITDSGREEFMRWLSEGGFDLELRSPLLMRTFFRGELPTEENIAYFAKMAAMLSAFLDGFQSEPPHIAQYAELINDPSKALYWKMTVEFGVMYAEMMRNWAEKCMKELEEMKHENFTD